MEKVNIELYMFDDECVFYSYESCVIPRKNEIITLNGEGYMVIDVVHDLSQIDTIKIAIKEIVVIS